MTVPPCTSAAPQRLIWVGSTFQNSVLQSAPRGLSRERICKRCKNLQCCAVRPSHRGSCGTVLARVEHSSAFQRARRGCSVGTRYSVNRYAGGYCVQRRVLMAFRRCFPMLSQDSTSTLPTGRCCRTPADTCRAWRKPTAIERGQHTLHTAMLAAIHCGAAAGIHQAASAARSSRARQHRRRSRRRGQPALVAAAVARRLCVEGAGGGPGSRHGIRAAQPGGNGGRHCASRHVPAGELPAAAGTVPGGSELRRVAAVPAEVQWQARRAGVPGTVTLGVVPGRIEKQEGRTSI